MPPAFSSLRQAAAFALLLLSFLAAPMLVSALGVLDRATVYPTLPAYAGPISHIQHELFEESSDVDIAFIGSSFMWSAIDAPYLQDELTRASGRQAVVRVLASVWPGLDRDYAFLKDLLSKRRVGLVVLQFPNRNRPTDDPAADVNRVSNEPHVQAFRFYRVGEMQEAVRGAPWDIRASLYAGAVLGMPRHMLTWIRPNYMAPTPVTETLGARLEPRGYFDGHYERFRPSPPRLDAESMILSDATAEDFRFFDEPLPDYQMYFARKIAALLEETGTPAILLHIPQANEITAEVVEERMDWREAAGISAAMVGVPPARLFGSFSEEEAKRFFGSDHLNDNGAIYFTRAVAPAILQVYFQANAVD